MKASNYSLRDESLTDFIAVLAGLTVSIAIKRLLTPTEPKPDTTAQLLRDPRNAARLLAAIERDKLGASTRHPLAERPATA